MKNELIAICDNCSTIFSANNFIGGNGTFNISFTNFKYGPCPNCGGIGNIPDGEYRLSDNIIKFIKGPNFSLNIVYDLKAYFEKLNINENLEKQKNQIISDVNKISPDFASVISTNSSIDYHKWIGTILAILSFIISFQQAYLKDNDSLSNEIVLELLKQNNSYQNIITQNTNQLSKNDSLINNIKKNALKKDW